jgi:hypothetical protein
VVNLPIFLQNATEFLICDPHGADLLADHGEGLGGSSQLGNRPGGEN